MLLIAFLLSKPVMCAVYDIQKSKLSCLVKKGISKALTVNVADALFPPKKRARDTRARFFTICFQ